jgi:hypothetical protein
VQLLDLIATDKRERFFKQVSGGQSMSKLLKGFLVIALALVVFSAAAEARGGHHGGGGWHGGWHGGGSGWGVPYWGRYPYYYAPGDCGWVRMRVWRHGYWVVQRFWRCW